MGHYFLEILYIQEVLFILYSELLYKNGQDFSDVWYEQKIGLCPFPLDVENRFFF